MNAKRIDDKDQLGMSEMIFVTVKNMMILLMLMMMITVLLVIMI